MSSICVSKTEHKDLGEEVWGTPHHLHYPAHPRSPLLSWPAETQVSGNCHLHFPPAASSHLKSKENLGGSRFDGQDAIAHQDYIICPSSPYYPLLLSCSNPVLSFRVYLPSLSKSVPCTPSTTASFTLASSSIQWIKAQALVLQISLAVCPLASYLTSLKLSFLICKMGINNTHLKMLWKLS